MADWMVEASRKSWIKQAVKSVSLPIALPEPLQRAAGPIEERVLEGRSAAVIPENASHGDIASSLSEAGAEIVAQEDAPLDILAFDASELTTVDDLDQLYVGLHGAIRRIRPCGRVIFITRSPEELGDAQAVAAQGAVEGVMRSLAKELGRKGITVNQLSSTEKARGRLAGPIRFIASTRSAFITGQRIEVSHSVRPPTDLTWSSSLDGRVALVTGAARGIGAAIASRLAEEGAHVVVLDRPSEDSSLTTVAERIGGTALELDVTDRDTPAALASWLKDNMGGVDIVIHNAGVTRDRTLGRMKESDWELVLEVNLRAILRIHEALERDVLSSYGRVMVLSSVMGISGNAGQANYAATKSALRTWVHAAAPATVRRGITINAIAPGFIETHMTDAIPAVTKEFGRRLSALGQGGVPQDVAELATFLASPGSHGITGQNIRVCGGMFFGA